MAILFAVVNSIYILAGFEIMKKGNVSIYTLFLMFVKMVDAVNKNGGSAKFTIYSENEHDAWRDTYGNPEVFNWLLSHTNKNAIELVEKYTDGAIYA